MAIKLTCDIYILTHLRSTHFHTAIRKLGPYSSAQSRTRIQKPASDWQEFGADWDLFFNLGKTHISDQMYRPPSLPGSPERFPVPPGLGPKPILPPLASEADVCTCLCVSTCVSGAPAQGKQRSPPCPHLCSGPAPFLLSHIF